MFLDIPEMFLDIQEMFLDIPEMFLDIPVSRLGFGAPSFSLLIVGYVGFLPPAVKLLEPEADLSHRSSAETELYLLLGMSHNQVYGQLY
jgi:hypothetical protein